MNGGEADEDIVDLAFALRGQAVAEEYAWLLRAALGGQLEWMAGEAELGKFGVHPLGGVSRSGGRLLLGHRARLLLRLPRRLTAAAAMLCGRRLDLGGPVEVGACTVRPLVAAAVVYSPFVCMLEDDELAFLEACRAALATLDMSPHLVSGKARRSSGDGDTVRGFSLMLHGLSAAESLRVQRRGLGPHRMLGCGVFVPHKSVAAVGE